ncbi:hypothetical protein Cgig2_018359 [Carnegiea gigantea]|uniref:Uncharacterized protein n=1 Tax=Carnegiea gigantea TaxID=171969 RepID=A0A9Q1JQ90_9CARY|nr:hypothetical protein Cgig2_018359 [Carnegiea gigantea]
MVISWLLHNVKKATSDNILFSSSSRQSDGTKFIQVKRDSYSISQANQDIATYFTHLKKLWDEHDPMIYPPRHRLYEWKKIIASVTLESKAVHKLRQQGPMLQEGARGKVLDGLHHVSNDSNGATTNKNTLIMQSSSKEDFQQHINTIRAVNLDA